MDIFRNFYQRNIEFFKQKYPKIIEKIKDEKSSLNLELLDTREDTPTLKVKDIFIYSRHFPLRHTQREVYKYLPLEGKNIVILGLGLGYHLLEVMRAISKEETVFVVEKELGIFKEFLKVCNWRRHIDLDQIIFFVDEEIKNVTQEIEEQSFKEKKEIVFIKNIPLFKMYEDYYRLIEKGIPQIFKNIRLKRIDLGCGENPAFGYLGVDKSKKVKPDIVCDIEKGLPFKDDAIEIVRCSHILEHITDLIGLMNEIYRICKNNALVDIAVPYFSSISAFRDPTHVRFFNEDTFYYFTEKQTLDYGFKGRFKIEDISFIYYPEAKERFEDLDFARKHYLNVVYSMQVKLRVVKDELR